jgi:hypothetical protein
MNIKLLLSAFLFLQAAQAAGGVLLLSREAGGGMSFS